ncbi:MAG: leucine-rich repeat domain-containing protein [Firmicutes bacterium]|nr:leucine-rich repeat domain-containing protein [Bacillota bacterium]
MKHIKRILFLSVVALLGLALFACSFGAGSGNPARLATPVITIENNIVSWNPIPNATEYVIEIDGEAYFSNVPAFSLASVLTLPKVYQIRVSAKGEGAYIDSNWSAYKDYFFELASSALIAPYSLNIYENRLTWQGSELAGAYMIAIDSETYQVTAREFDLSILTDAKTYNIKIMSLNLEDSSLNSDWSEALAFSIERLGFTLRDNFYEVVSIGNVSSSHLVVPSSYNGMQVRRIAFGAFEGANITKLTIPFIGQSAQVEVSAYFGYIFGAPNFATQGEYVPESLKEVILTGGTSIPPYAFANCDKIERITMEYDIANPSTITSIGHFAFQNCSSLVYMPIHGKITSIGIGAFAGCDSMASFYVETFAPMANPLFYSQGNCLIEKDTKKLIAGLKTSIIPSDIKIIGENAFQDCINLANITIPSGVTEILSNAFSGCINLESVVLSANLKTIGSYAFKNCISLKSVSLPITVESIYEKAFENCDIATFYCESEAWRFEGWHSLWNSAKRPVLWNCVFSEDKTYVASFHTSSSIENFIGNTILAPYREGYTFIGWAQHPTNTVAFCSAEDIINVASMELFTIWNKNS